jgi:hypothetical protein
MARRCMSPEKRAAATELFKAHNKPCPYRCTGAGSYLVEQGAYVDEAERRAWDEAHATCGDSCTGWHTIPCPDCNGTGRAE